MFEFRIFCLTIAVALLLGGWTSSALAQTASLFGRGVSDTPSALVMANSSWMYDPVDPPRVIKLNDLITVMVVETSQVTSDNTIQPPKAGTAQLDLANFIRLKGCRPSPPTRGQQINGTLQGQFQAQSNLATADLLRFSIQARVVDIRPTDTWCSKGIKR